MMERNGMTGIRNARHRASVLREMGLAPLWKLRNVQHLPASAHSAQVETKSDAVPDDVSPPTDERASAIAQMSWQALRTSVAECRACALCQERKQAVLGTGDESADWLFVGEGPGAEEDVRGEPFVGQAGKLLDAMLRAIGLQRGAHVYIANAVKCRPPGNRTPRPEEIAACRPYLERQISLLQPRLIVALGRPAAQALLQEELKIASARGQLHTACDVPVVVSYHPAYLLRTPADKALAWEDLCLARRTMQGLRDRQATDAQ